MQSILRGAAAVLVLAAASFSAHAQQSASDTGSASVTVIRPISVTKNADLAFGTLVRGNGTASVSTAGARSVTGGVQALASTTPANAQFTVSGEGGQSITVTIPAPIALGNTTSGATGALTVTTSNDLSGAAGSQVLSGALGQAVNGSLVVKVGGSVTLTDATDTGVYAGTFTVAANYN
jgi:hypothetical protein